MHLCLIHIISPLKGILPSRRADTKGVICKTLFLECAWLFPSVRRYKKQRKQISKNNKYARIFKCKIIPEKKFSRKEFHMVLFAYYCLFCITPTRFNYILKFRVLDFWKLCTIYDRLRNSYLFYLKHIWLTHFSNIKSQYEELNLFCHRLWFCILDTLRNG